MLDEREDAIQIHGDGAMPLFFRHAVDGCVLRGPDAVIRDQNVESPEGRDRRRYQLPRRRGGGKIALQRATVFRATFPHQILGLGPCRLIIEYNFRARGYKHPHRRRANPARSAGDKRSVVREKSLRLWRWCCKKGKGGRKPTAHMKLFTICWPLATGH